MNAHYRLLLGILMTQYASGALADDNIPALLHFAEKYNDSRLSTGGSKRELTKDKLIPEKKLKPNLSKEKIHNHRIDKTNKKFESKTTAKPSQMTERKRLQAQSEQLKAQQTTIAQLQKELAEIKKISSPILTSNYSTPNLQSLTKIIQRARKSLSFTDTNSMESVQLHKLNKKNANLSAQLTALERDNARLHNELTSLTQHDKDDKKNYKQVVGKEEKLQEELAKVRQMLLSKEKVLADKEQVLTLMQQEASDMKETLDNRETVLQKSLLEQSAAKQKMDMMSVEQVRLQKLFETLEKKNKETEALSKDRERARMKLEMQLKAEAEREEQLKTELSTVREQSKWLATPKSLETDEASQAYAAGVALGQDIQGMLDERKSWGMRIDSKTLLSGIIDTFTGHYQLTAEQLEREVLKAEKSVEQTRAKIIKQQDVVGETFVADFKKKNGVKQSSAGFWYHIDYAGDEAIPETAIVDVVVKESLSDGTVIQDMDIGGKVLSQSMMEYPPLFRAAISLLKNHGSLTMVVPPSLAYGDKGYPPTVPPNATMVYVLRIEGVNVPELK